MPLFEVGEFSMFPLTIPIRVHRPGRRDLDEYGDPATRPGRVDDITVFGVVEGGDDTPNADNPERTRYGLTVLAPVSAAITTEDRIEWSGHLYNVDGPPGVWDANPWWSPGLARVRCTRVEG